MRRILPLFLFACLLITSLRAQKSIYPDLTYSSLTEIYAEDGLIVTTGTCDAGMYSLDDGQSWQTFTLPNTISDIAVLDNNGSKTVVLMGFRDIYTLDLNTGEIVAVTGDDLELAAGFFYRIFNYNNTLYLVSSRFIFEFDEDFNYEMIVSFDWSETQSDIADINGNTIYVGARSGLVKKVNLNDNTVTDYHDFGERIFSMSIPTENIGYFDVQNESNPLKTSDGGMTFESLTNMPENIGLIAYGENFLGTINTNRMYRSTDGGQSSTYTPYTDMDNVGLIQDRFMTSDGTLYLSGGSNTIIRTADFGETFEYLNDYKRARLQDIHFNGDVGYAVGGENSIIRTEDGGNTWTSIELPAIYDNNNYMQAVRVISENRVVVATNDGIFTVENDEVIHHNEESCDWLFYNSEKDYLLAVQTSGNDRIISKSTDGGLSWNFKTFATDCYFIDISEDGKLFASIYTGNLITSTDDGETWQIENIPDLDAVRDINFYTSELGIMSIGNSLYKTTDGGETVEQIATGYSLHNLTILNEDHYLYTSAQNSSTTVKETRDGGETWTNAQTYCPVSYQSYYNEETNELWFSQDGGHINKMQIVMVNTEDEIASESESFQVYPSMIQAGQDLILKTNETISMENISLTSSNGRCIMVDLYEIAKGKYSIPTGRLPQGIYYITLHTADSHSTKSIAIF